MKKILALILAALLSVSMLAACGAKAETTASTEPETAASETASAETNDTAVSEETASSASYTIGICNYVDDASLNQIVDNIQTKLAAIGAEKGVTFNVEYDNCNADSNLMSQIISNFQADNADLLVAVATPVAMAMQAATEETGTPVVFAAVSDPVSVGLVDSLDAPGSNLTGTSDYLDTASVMNLMFVQNPEIKKVGLLYDLGQDSAASAIASAKDYLENKGVEVIERTGTSVDEIALAAQALVADGVDAVFTPTDNTVMKSELTIYETFAEAGIPHYTGADSFALNGAFLGYGVDYANLGVETANMIPWSRPSKPLITARLPSTPTSAKRSALTMIPSPRNLPRTARRCSPSSRQNRLTKYSKQVKNKAGCGELRRGLPVSIP